MSSFIRKFIALGHPPNAVKYSGLLRNVALSRNAQILATQKDQTETIFSASRSLQPSIIYQDSDARPKWKFNHNIVVAESAAEGKEVSVLAAPGGLYRIDVAYGAKFQCEPAKIMGVNGDLKASIFYVENRFDVLKAWTNWALKGSYTSINTTWLRAKQLLSKIPIPQKVRSSFSSVKLPKLINIPPQYQKKLLRTREVVREYRRKVSEYLFTLFHPAKIEVQGPCSLLIKP